VQGALGHDQPAHVLREVAGKAEQFAGQVHQLPPQPRTGIEADLAKPGHHVLAAVDVVQRFGQLIDPVERKPQRFADVADGRTGTVGDDLRRHAGPVAAVLLVDVLDDLFPSLVLEVDVDVGRFIPFFADEPLEQQVDAVRVDRGHAQAVADGRIGRRPPPLTEDVPPARKPHEVPHREKVGLITEFLDQRQFVFDELPHLVRQAVRIPSACALPRQPPQVFHGGRAGRA
jgi:hypothetical protein